MLVFNGAVLVFNDSRWRVFSSPEPRVQLVNVQVLLLGIYIDVSIQPLEHDDKIRSGSRPVNEIT